MKKIIALVSVLLLIGIGVACTTGGGGAIYIPPGDYVYHDDPIPVEQNQEQFQAQVQTQSQNQWQSVSQQNSQQVTVTDGNTLDVGAAQLYSRLVYPGEVLTFAVGEGDGCSVIAAYPVGLYTITTVHGYGVDMVQTKESQPVYDPIRHKMEFGHVPVVDKIDYWTEKAFLKASKDGFCVLDNRAPGNQFVTVELTVFKRVGL